MPLNAMDFDFLRKFVQQRCAIVLEDQKAYFVEARLQQVVFREGFASLEALVRQLRNGLLGVGNTNRNQELQQKVIEAMTTNETSFFRDGHPFEALRKKVIPELVRVRTKTKQLHIWCAACSTGQEPYSLAMLVCEYFPQLTRPDWGIHILATDLSSDVLTRAREARFGRVEINRGLPVQYRNKFFRHESTSPAQGHGKPSHSGHKEEAWVLCDSVRRMVEFRQLNLTHTWPLLPQFDLILLRNVLIYFDQETKRAILRRVHQHLRPDGYLLLGGAENTLSLDKAFERIPFEGTSLYRLR